MSVYSKDNDIKKILFKHAHKIRKNLTNKTRVRQYNRVAKIAAVNKHLHVLASYTLLTLAKNALYTSKKKFGGCLVHNYLPATLISCAHYACWMLYIAVRGNKETIYIFTMLHLGSLTLLSVRFQNVWWRWLWYI